MDIGILGGTFDPIHKAHFIVAEEVRTKLELDQILFVPAGQPWVKEDRPISPAVHRVEMVRRAISSNPRFRLSTLEVERPGPSYSVDTVDALRNQLGAEARLFFLLGSDALSDLPQWKDPSRLIQMCHLVAFSRPGCGSPPSGSLELAIPGISDRVTLVEVSQIDISSTEIRSRVARGLSIAELVPEAVERYIQEHGLYLGR